MSFKRTKVVMLPTNQKAKMGDLTMFGNKLVVASSVLHLAQVSQNLYFLSDEEIKEGDWYVNFKLNDKNWNEIIPDRVCKADLNKTNEFKVHPYSKYCKKIIATTDNTLVIEGKDASGYIAWRYQLPQPSEGFIQKFVEAYNSGNPIKEVDVEYENLWVGYEPDYFEINGELIDGMKKVYSIFLKVNSKDNTITIKKVKDTYTQEEVDDLLDRNTAQTTAQILEKFKGFKSRDEVSKLLHSLAHDVSINNWNSFEKIDKWIEENL